jgi:type I restriction enzyme, S subunit
MRYFFDYFLHIFRSEYVQNQVRDMACVGTVGSYTISNGRKTTVLLPPMSEQKHIATTLSTLDRHAEELQAELAKAQNIKQGMMRYFFGD